MEHTICRMKKHRIIIGKVFRNRLRNYDRVSEIASGLINYRTLVHLFRWASSVIAMLIENTVSDYARDLPNSHLKKF